MATLTLKNIPDNLYIRLKEAAQAHHRSMNSEILYCVERTLGVKKVDVSEQLKMARTLREKTMNHPLDEDELNAAKHAGRP
jgi:plasmid stability protein